ncbi:hypothetical protein FS837_001596 [Tulasnella sp. UAMH 9824]|nr:hypothetical protein FS837_001596 [Tulasnella sp. UAMH 9824]
MAANDLEYPDDLAGDLSASVRRHHTISAARRPPRAHPRVGQMSETAAENEDEVVGSDWVGGVGAVGEGKGLHRQSSLPSSKSKYTNSRLYARQHGASSGTMTPSRVGMNSLSAITAEHGIDGDEQDEALWDQIRDWRGDDLAPEAFGGPLSNPHIPSSSEHNRTLSQSSQSSSIAPMMSEEASVTPLSGAAGAGVRRHQSLTYGAHGHAGGSAARSLMRSATTSRSKHPRATDIPPVPVDYPVDSQALAADDQDDEGIVSPTSNSTGHGSAGHGKPWGAQSSNSGTTSPWGQPAAPTHSGSDDLVDNIQRGLAGIELDAQQRHAPYGSYYTMYGNANNNQTLSQPPPNPNHNRKLTPPPTYPPRFRSPSPGHSTELPYASAIAAAALKAPNTLQTGAHPASQVTASSGRSPIHKLSLVTNLPGSQGAQKELGPVSAAAYVPPPGGGLPLGEELGGTKDHSADGGPTPIGSAGRDRDKPLTATGTAWDEKQRIVGSRSPAHLQHDGASNGPFNPASIFANPAVFSSFDPALQQQIMQAIIQQQGTQGMSGQPQPPFIQGTASPPMQGFSQGLQNLQLLQHQVLQQQLLQAQQLYAGAPHGQYAQPQHHGLPTTRLNAQVGGNPLLNGGLAANGNGAGFGGFNAAGAVEADNPLASPVDVQSLVTAKGYNPTTFDCKPASARYFVIKSYTEDDVHKSLKYEIWSSTEPGNKRLDKAFKENNGRGPIYLFFSVNASGHFCGVAEMLTPVDYTRSSTVWAQDKWKGVIKVKWVFVRDVPNSVLRHIRLTNTQEMKPVTNSRDTQELPPEAGQEMLRIFLTHTSRTSLLQDFAFYELQSLQKTLTTNQPMGGQPPAAPQQHPSPQPNMPSRQASLPPAMGGGFASPPQNFTSQMLPQQDARQTTPPRQGNGPMNFGGIASPPTNRI